MGSLNVVVGSGSIQIAIEERMYATIVALRFATVYIANRVVVTRPNRFRLHFTGVEMVAESLEASVSGRLVSTTAVATRV